jgi:PAS domain S-box-containing protein
VLRVSRLVALRARYGGYALALVATALTAVMRWLLPGVLAPAPYLAFYPAVVLAAAVGGFGPGLVATLGSLLCVNFLFGPEDPGAMMRQVVWVVANVGVSALAAMQRASRRRSELVVQQSRDIILFIRLDDGRILEANPAAVRAYGYGREELLAHSIRDLRAPGTAELIAAQMTEARTRGVLFESVHRRKDGTTFPVEVSSRGVTLDGAEMLVSVVRDVTDRTRAEEALRGANEQLREAGRRKDVFLGMLSHELRNPLAPIRNAAYVLRRAEPRTEQATRAQDIIERQTEHLTRLVDDLLDVTRIARGKIELRREIIDLREVAWRAADDFWLTMNGRGIRFQTALPDAQVWADADATRIAQVVGNLLHNAAKYTRRGDEVTLSLRAVDGVAEIRVRDTGAGIDAALLPHVFDSFVQGERTLARSEGGLGLGLALVKSITELHGGTVAGESGGHGKGAEFVVRLPLAGPRPAQEPPRVEARPPSRGHRVLVVDDNVDAAQSLAELVVLLGHTAEVAHDGPSALEKARANPPSVVLCDIGLPGMSGYDVARALRSSGLCGVQLIAVTGYAQPEDKRRAAEAGFDAHLSKPCETAEIARILA